MLTYNLVEMFLTLIDFGNDQSCAVIVKISVMTINRQPINSYSYTHMYPQGSTGLIVTSRSGLTTDLRIAEFSVKLLTPQSH